MLGHGILNMLCFLSVVWAGPSVVPTSPAGAFSLKTTSGTFKYDPSAGRPLQLIALDDNDVFGLFAFGGYRNDPEADAFLVEMVTDQDLVLVSRSQDAEHLMTGVSWYLQRRIDSLGWSQAEKEARMAQLHFATEPLAVGSTPAQVLANWTTDHTMLSFFMKNSAAKSSNTTVPRLDGYYGTFPWPPRTGPATDVVLAPEPCQRGLGLPEGTAKGVYVLAEHRYGAAGSPNCSHVQLLRNAGAAQATGAILFPGAHSPAVETRAGVELLNCTSSTECDQVPNVPGTFIRRSDGLAMVAMLQSAPEGIQASFGTDSTALGWSMGAGSDGRLAQLGWRKLPTARYASWSTQWFDFQTRLRKNVTDTSVRTHVVQAFSRSVMQGTAGVVVNASLPTRAAVSEWAHRLELDLALGCPTLYDDSCPIWDHTPQLFVCCEGQSGAECGAELGRWITPFRRGVGRWLTDITPLAPLLLPATGTTNECHLQMKMSASWAMPWVPSLSIRFIDGPDGYSGSKRPLPDSLAYLFAGGTFDSQYNNRSAVQVEVPPGMASAQLVAVITGHGSDPNGCGEFCSTQHNFTITSSRGTVSHVVAYLGAGSPFGCAEQTINGAIPNEHGTAYYGRDGWCDGNRVRPWVVDITDDVPEAAGDLFSVTYEGKWCPDPATCAAPLSPDPESSPGVIIMNSWVSFTSS